MIDIRDEQLVRLQRVPKLLPSSMRTGRPVHISAVYRWVQSGRLSAGGQRVRLEVAKIGGSTLTSIEALQRFADRLSEAGHEKFERPSPGRSKHSEAEVLRVLER